MANESILDGGTAAVRVHLPLALRPEAGGAACIDVRADDAGQALTQLFSRHRALRRHLLDDTGALRPHVNVFVNQADVRSREGLATRVREGDDIHVVPSIAGG